MRSDFDRDEEKKYDEIYRVVLRNIDYLEELRNFDLTDLTYWILFQRSQIEKSCLDIAYNDLNSKNEDREDFYKNLLKNTSQGSYSVNAIKTILNSIAKEKRKRQQPKSLSIGDR